MTYSEKLKSPKWQKKRLEIMERDGFQCQMCFNREKTLTVHHKYYTKGKEPWQYDNDCLITLCEDCHESVHLWIKTLKEHPEKLEYFALGLNVNITDYRIFQERISMIYKREGDNSIKSIIQLLTAYVIDLKNM